MSMSNLSFCRFTYGTSVTGPKSTLNIIDHFNYFLLSNFVEFGLSVVNGGNDCRKTKEMRLIHALGTLNPHGMNERFTFC